MPYDLKAVRKLTLDGSRITNLTHIAEGSFSDGVNTVENLPPFTRTAVVSEPGSGSYIRFEVWMPDDWNGIFLGLGNGGMAGAIHYGALAERIRQGYAAVHTDMGTSRRRNSGIGNPDVWKDFGWRATHIMTEQGKAIARAYYGEKEKYAYFIGGSTGGQQAYAEAQRFPADYDGILAGVPANNRVYLHTYFLWNHVHLTTRDGDTMFTDEEITAITDCAARFLGENGDNFVAFPWNGADTVERFLAYLRKAMPALTDGQFDALRAVYSGPVNPKTGERIYNGMPIGSEIYGCGIRECQRRESPHFYPFIWAFGADYCGHDFDFAEDLDRMGELLSGDLNANDPDLRPFRENGGRLLAYSGSADPCVPFPDAMAYYNRAADICGGDTAEFFRYFVLPGMDHGSGGRGVNRVRGEGGISLLDALRRWREEGVAPDCIEGAREADGETVFVRRMALSAAERTAGRSCPPCWDARYLKM